MTWLRPVTLSSPHYSLVPLAQAHRDDLVVAVNDGELWKLWYTSIPEPQAMAEDIEKRLLLQAGGTMLPFAVIDNSNGTAVGMTTYLHADATHRRLEIGATWYRRSLQRTGLNSHCKFLLLSHAFESLDCIAVEFRTHFFNQQSRRAIERLGAKHDGILRCHQIASNGTLRDTCVYSILATEWPVVKANLAWQMGRTRDGEPMS